MHGILQDLANTLILTRSRLGLFCINMCKLINELWPLNHVRISEQLNVLKLNEGNSIKFGWVGIVMYQLVQIYNKVMVFKSC